MEPIGIWNRLLHPEWVQGRSWKYFASTYRSVLANREQIKTYAVFFHGSGRFLADMKLANYLSSDSKTRILFSRETQSLVLYGEDTDAIQIDLSDMHASVSAVAVDTQKPYAEIPVGRLKPKAQTLTLPSVSDWVVAVGGFRKKSP